MKKIFLVVTVFFSLACLAYAQGGMKKKRPKPIDYGKVVINNFSEKAGLAPVQFDHWAHRSKYTCRLCHVDIGFAMKGGETQVRAMDNMRGHFCGVCHNGIMQFDDRRVFSACSKEVKQSDLRRCERCHVKNPSEQRAADFDTLTEKLPRERFGNGINWEKAEELGLIKPIDYLEGISIKRAKMAVQKDFAINAKVAGMPEIIFSHKKHTVWNGCEVCHPDIFVGVKKGATRYTMIELFDGKYCGVCHDTVAFPQIDCQRCHSKPIQ